MLHNLTDFRYLWRIIAAGCTITACRERATEIMYPKFIIAARPGTTGGFLRMGMAYNHKDLVIGYEKVYGGGWWSRNDEKKEIILYGSSGDYGSPKFSCLSMAPAQFRDYTFIYTPYQGLPGNVLDMSDVTWV